MAAVARRDVLRGASWLTHVGRADVLCVGGNSRGFDVDLDARAVAGAVATSLAHGQSDLVGGTRLVAGPPNARCARQFYDHL
jgi:hypothetical protein